MLANIYLKHKRSNKKRQLENNLIHPNFLKINSETQIAFGEGENFTYSMSTRTTKA